MLMEMFTKENGKMTKHMDMELIFTLMELNMKVSGKKTNKMEKEKKHGQMVLVIKEII